MMHQSYDPLLVLASMIVASVAGYAALDLSSSVAIASGWSRARWIMSSAIAMGGGIWSMHFVAMLALTIDVPVTYNIPLLLGSLLIAVSASPITFSSASDRATTAKLAFASFATGQETAAGQTDSIYVSVKAASARSDEVQIPIERVLRRQIFNRLHASATIAQGPDDSDKGRTIVGD